MFRAANRKFKEKDAQVLGISTDPQPVQAAYATSLGSLPYPLLSDFYPHGQVAQLYDIFDQETGVSKRAVFIIDRDGIVRFRRVYRSASYLDVADVLARVSGL